MGLRPITRVMMVVEEFRKIDPELPMQIALVFIMIADKPGISQKELVARSGMGRSSVSRHCAYLSKEYGKGLVTIQEDPVDRRSKVCKLTPAGERTIQSLTHYVETA